MLQGEQRLSVSNATTLTACGRECYDNAQCSLFVWCPSAKGCTVSGAPRQLLYIPPANSSVPVRITRTTSVAGRACARGRSLLHVQLC